MGKSNFENTDAGTPVAGPPAALRQPLLFAWILIALSLGTGAAAFRTFNRHESSVGYLQARTRGVYARAEARIAAILVKPGEIVEPGTPLVQLQDLQLERRLREIQQRIAVQRAQLDERLARAEIELHNRRQSLDTEAFQVRMQKAGFERHVEYPAGSITNTAVRPISEGDETPPQVSAAEPPPFIPQIRMCDDRLAQLEREAKQLPEEIKVACGVKTAEARLKQLEQELADLELEHKTLTLVAEVHGTVGLLQAQTGDLVPARGQIVSLMDEDQPYLVVKVPSDRLVDYAPGTPLRILFPGRIERQGKVEAVPPQAETEAKNSPSAPTQIAVVVAPTGAAWPKIPFGASVEVQRDR